MKNIKNESLIIIGQSGSGKSYLLRKMVEKGLKAGLKTTTRPIRKFEKQGIDYDYINNDEFSELINENKMMVHQSFVVTPENLPPDIWYYGLTIEEFNNSQLFILTPKELSELTIEQRKECFVVYLNIDRDVREKRLYKRNDQNDSIKRRLDSDDIDFDVSIDYDLMINDPEFSADDIYDLMN